jgi:hypothetical protein
MHRVTLKTSTIFIAAGARTRVYRSVEEVPALLRKKLEASTNSLNSATILIADRRGREEIIRALQGLPTPVRSRLASSLADPDHEPGMKFRIPWQRFAQFLLPIGAGLALWLAFNAR